jgi:hypothetical protein
MRFPIVSFTIPVSIVRQANPKAPAQDVDLKVWTGMTLTPPTQIKVYAQQFVIVAIKLNLQCAILAHSPRTIVDVSELTGTAPVSNANAKSNHDCSLPFDFFMYLDAACTVKNQQVRHCIKSAMILASHEPSNGMIIAFLGSHFINALHNDPDPHREKSDGCNIHHRSFHVT